MNIGHAQEYWKYVPDGIGKCNTEELLFLTDKALELIWNKAIRNRWKTYPEERSFVFERCQQYNGKRIFSVGPGLGFHELIYANNGAKITCFDIVESNLLLLKRLARQFDLSVKICKTFTDLSHSERYDVFYFWGSLHHMTAQWQRNWLQIVEALLELNGRLIIMSYTWKYVQKLCPDMTKETFDPVRFGAVSDPAIGKLVCPWADWHDADKIMSLRSMPFRLIEEQLFNRDLFAWYVFEKIK